METTVSTHSRLKAAGVFICALKRAIGFNTQPPKGGWGLRVPMAHHPHVSTHSRLKAAGVIIRVLLQTWMVSTHSRLKAAGESMREEEEREMVSTHSRLKAAG